MDRPEDFTRWSSIWRVLYDFRKKKVTGYERLPGGLAGRCRVQNSCVWWFSEGFKHRLLAQLPVLAEIEYFLGHARSKSKLPRAEVPTSAFGADLRSKMWIGENLKIMKKSRKYNISSQWGLIIFIKIGFLARKEKKEN